MKITQEDLEEFLIKVKKEYCSKFSLPENISIFKKTFPQNRISAETKNANSSNPKIFISERLIEKLQNTQDNDKNKEKLNCYGSILRHAIHHELCHIEISRAIPIFNYYLENKENDKFLKEKLTCKFLDEYFACYLSSKSISKENTMVHFETFKNFDRCLEKVELISDFIIDGAYFLGETANIKEFYRYKLMNTIENTDSIKILLQLEEIALQLIDRYKEITDNDIQEVKQAFCDAYKALKSYRG